MKIALISDVHGNRTALKAVLYDIHQRKVDQVVCLGDVVGYGPQPLECLHLVKNCCRTTVLGNHDATMFDPDIHLERMKKVANRAARFALKRMTNESLTYLSDWPLRAELDEGRVLLAHGSYVQQDVWHYLDDEESVGEELRGLPEEMRVCFVGHTHVPFVFSEREGLVERLSEHMLLNPEDRYVINVGSVGQPRDGDCRACYCILEIENGEYRLSPLIRMFYNIRKTERAMRSVMLPRWLSERLYSGD